MNEDGLWKAWTKASKPRHMALDLSLDAFFHLQMDLATREVWPLDVFEMNVREMWRLAISFREYSPKVWTKDQLAICNTVLEAKVPIWRAIYSFHIQTWKAELARLRGWAKTLVEGSPETTWPYMETYSYSYVNGRRAYEGLVALEASLAVSLFKDAKEAHLAPKVVGDLITSLRPLLADFKDELARTVKTYGWKIKDKWRVPIGKALGLLPPPSPGRSRPRPMALS